MQPGQVIGPGNQAPEESPKPAEPAAPTQPVPEKPDVPEPASGWEFREDESPNQGSMAQPSQHEAVTWTASEYIAHEKSMGWYVLLGLAIAGAAIVVYLLTQELVSSIVIAIMGVAFGAFAARKPQELEYELSNTGLRIGNKLYSYGQFKSFTVVDEDGIHAIVLMPLQRFMPPLSVYYDPADEDKIAEALTSYLPYQDRKQDVVDRFMRKVRF